MKPVLKFCILLLLLAGCRHRNHTAAPAFYYWKTSYTTNNFEQRYTGALGVKKLYLRCFDVDWNDMGGAPEPVAVVRLPEAMDTSFEYVPVVFITQKAMATTPQKNVASLSQKISALLQDICNNSSMAPREIQIDCDWTAGSRDSYFLLLQSLRAREFFRNKKLSCTIRLHQIKYRLRSGVPPADGGMLMCYNVGNLKQPTAHNSIIDVPLTEDYLSRLDAYPLPLDVALPVFSWCVLFRAGVFKGIIRDADPAELQAPLFRKSEGNMYTVMHDAEWHGYTLFHGDVIRAEASAMADLKAVAAFTSRHLSATSLTIAFFHLDSVALSHYSTDELKMLLDAYH